MTELLDSPVVLAVVIGVLWLLYYGLDKFTRRAYARQTVIESDLFLPEYARGSVFALPFLLPVVAISLTLSADRGTREFFGGGCLVFLMANLGLQVSGFWITRRLADPTAVQGHIHYSATGAYRSAGAQMVGLAIFSGVVGILVGSLAVVAGSFFLLAAGIGYYRRARQASRKKV